MRPHLVLFTLLVAALLAHAEVRVFIQANNGVARLNYEGTAGEVIRAFALNVSVDRGQITGVSDYLRGESRVGSQGYGIFPAAFRDHLTASGGTNVNWEAPGYTPLAVVADALGGTLPGLGSSGVTLEFGALWDPAAPTSVPAPAGTLCALQLTEPAQVTVAPNTHRGGVVAAYSEQLLTTVFTGAWVDPTLAITSMEVSGAMLTIRFKGGELDSAPRVDGPWTGTGNTSGVYTESVASAPAKFYRVRRP